MHRQSESKQESESKPPFLRTLSFNNKPENLEFDTRSGKILSFLLPLFQEGQLSVTGESTVV